MNWWALALAVLGLALLGLYLSMTAGRLDRLHRRIDTSASALDVLLLKRSALALDLPSVGVFDPATTLVLADSAHEARSAGESDAVTRGLAESDLTRVLVAALPDQEEVRYLRDDAEAAAMIEELRNTCLRVPLARRFLNDAVRACRQVRKQRLVRWLKLAGRTQLPVTVEMDDTPPPGLVGR